MAKVYFSKDINKILENIDYSKLGQKVAIKVHFGEKGCETYLNPEYARKFYQKIKNLGKEPTLVECNVLYKGSRTESTEHIKTAKEHGFTEMNIDILDGEKGEYFLEVDNCKIGKGLGNYDSLIVLSHFKGHGASGFGGAIKNMSMGLGSRAGKLDMHSKIRPRVSEEKCIACQKCIENCNFGAISLTGNKAQIDENKCEGCAMCIAVCPAGAIRVPWQGRTSEELQKRMAEYSKAIIKLFPNAIFINVLEKITAECDCRDIIQKPLMEDVGILLSADIVAIDKASLDLAEKFSKGGFGKINEVDKYKQIEIAEKLGLGFGEYELAEI